MSQWCMVVMRNVRCRNNHSYQEIIVADVVTIYGPFSKSVAMAKVDLFNEGTTAGSRVSLCDDEPSEYRPIANAPAFVDQEHWIEHWAITRPMNDVEW